MYFFPLSTIAKEFFSDEIILLMGPFSSHHFAIVYFYHKAKNQTFIRGFEQYKLLGKKTHDL